MVLSGGCGQSNPIDRIANTDLQYCSDAEELLNNEQFAQCRECVMNGNPGRECYREALAWRPNGSTVDLKVPPLVGLELHEALDVLDALSLAFQVDKSPDDSMQEAMSKQVEDQAPDPGDPIEPGETVRLWVAEGTSQQNSVEVPNLVGMKLRQARAVLEGLSLHLSVDNSQHDTGEEALRTEVTGQTPNPGAYVEPGSTVKLELAQEQLDSARLRAGMVTVRAGEFQRGCDDRKPDESCSSGEQPLHTVHLDEYAIDKYEVTNAEYAEFLNAEGNQVEGGVTWLEAGSSWSRIHDTNGDWEAEEGYENHPVVTVTWYGARAYCEWRGKRLPTEAEWEKAARGASDTRIYPWGDENPDCSRLNYKDATEGYCVDDTTPIGSYPSGASPYGALDMAGNVGEWVNDWYDDDYYDTSPDSNPSGPSSGFGKVVRGGSWFTPQVRARTAYRYRSGGPNANYKNVGFRCAGAAPGE
jgi:formylglycine-generating enzyme required for sulfatase activity